MKIDNIIIEDKKTGFYFIFIRQFPGICAQAKTIKEASKKINTYWQKFIKM